LKSFFTSSFNSSFQLKAKLFKSKFSKLTFLSKVANFLLKKAFSFEETSFSKVFHLKQDFILSLSPSGREVRREGFSAIL